MTVLDQLTARRAVESLRCGVPSGAAVRAMGWSDPAHTLRFQELLRRAMDLASSGGGLLVKGDFGTGKSHLLGRVERLALDANFVVSRVVISKETPLFQPESVLVAALRDGKVPGSRGSVLHEIALRLDFSSADGVALKRWVGQGLGMLSASLHLLERTVELGDDELIARVVDWWSGEKLTPAEIRVGLKTLKAQQAFDVKAIRMADLTDLRIGLASHVIRAAGFSGWLILLDELELVGRYSPLQRAKSYAQLSRWFGHGDALGRSIACVGTITDDFSTKVLDGGQDGLNDRLGLPTWLRSRGRLGDEELASAAEAGMDFIDDPDPIYLSGPDGTLLQATYERVREVYSAAFRWDPPIQTHRSQGITTPMRTYIKTWIYAWDLMRLGVTERPSIQAESLSQSYERDATLEEGSDSTEGDDQ